MSNMTTRTRKGGKEKTDTEEHQLSDSDSTGEETGKQANSLEFTEQQMQTVSLLVRSAVSAAVAQVIPLARTQGASTSQDALHSASPPFSSAQLDVNTSSGSAGNKTSSESLEEGEVKDEQLDEYERALKALLGDNLVTGPEISDKIGRLLERCLGSPLDEEVVKEKRDAFPRPQNISNLKVPIRLFSTRLLQAIRIWTATCNSLRVTLLGA